MSSVSLADSTPRAAMPTIFQGLRTLARLQLTTWHSIVMSRAGNDVPEIDKRATIIPIDFHPAPPRHDGGSGSAPKRRRIGDAADVEMEEAEEQDDRVELKLRPGLAEITGRPLAGRPYR